MIFKRTEALIFDLDGTLFQTDSILDEAYYQTFYKLKEKGLYDDKIPSIKKMYNCVGMIGNDLWSELLPNSTKQVQHYASNLILSFQIDKLKKGLGKLYPSVIETMQNLYQNNYRLFVASNGLENYVKSIIKYSKLEELIEEVYSAGEYGTTSKVELVELILENHNIDNAWMIGDRSSDVEAGKKNGLFVVGCNYANFKKEKELVNADIVINEMKDVLEYL